jgi:hypothetical protein
MIFKFSNKKSQKVTTFADLDPGDTFLLEDIDISDLHFFDTHSVYLRLNEQGGSYVDLDTGDICSIVTSGQLFNTVVFPVVLESEVQKI